MKNYCISFSLYFVAPSGKEYPVRSAYTKATLVNYAKKIGLSSYCILTYHTENLVSTIAKKEYYND